MPELLRVARAVATNQLAWLAPRAYLRMTAQTGRGDSGDESPEDIADYFRRCVDDYLAFAGVPAQDAESVLENRTILEYGPGDFPGVALLLLAHGARKVYCVDRFPMIRLSPKNLDVWRAMLDGMGDNQRRRALALLRDPDLPAKGLRPGTIEYLVRPYGFSGLSGEADLVISRAVLEHVDDLPGTFADMLEALRPGGQAWHLVDLKSHGLHRTNPLDFLAWPAWLWKAMYSHKGVPNRWRLDTYRRILHQLPIDELRLEPTLRASAADVAAVRPQLAPGFRALSDDDLACLGMWVGFRKPGR